MRKFFANIFWNIAVWNISVAQKIKKSDRATFTRVIEAQKSTIYLPEGVNYPFKAGDKVLIVK